MSLAVRSAECHCGALALECVGEPTKVSLCHCRDCQRRTGSAFSVAAFFPRTAVTRMRGTAHSHCRGSASGNDVIFHFCPTCGTNLWWEPERMPALVGVAAGAFADPAFPRPEQAVWAEHALPWTNDLAELRSHARNPEPKRL